jgi:quinol monooxygenase YgiN
MILEIAQADIRPGQEAALRDAITKSIPIFKREKGCCAIEFYQSMEHPNRIRVLVWWKTLEAHVRDFVGSSEYTVFLGLFAPLLEGEPQLEHHVLLGEYKSLEVSVSRLVNADSCYAGECDGSN